MQLYAQGAPQPEDTVCVQAEKVPEVKADMPQGDTSKFNNCSAWNLYYGKDEKADIRLARLCAFTESDENDVESRAVLSMIYAGGKGVAPNLPLAIRYACEIQTGWDSGSEKADQLEEQEQKGATRVDFDFCDAPTGRKMDFFCIDLHQYRTDHALFAAEHDFDYYATGARKAALDALLEARAVFMDAHGYELHGGTVGTSQAAIAAVVDTENVWIHTLKDLAAGKLPHFTHQDFLGADAALNDHYQDAKTDAAACDDPQYCTTTDQLVHAERAWLAYRDAWVAYGRLRWPQVSADSWRTMVTRERTDMLINDE
jgi:lysozyme inhibitor LprI